MDEKLIPLAEVLIDARDPLIDRQITEGSAGVIHRARTCLAAACTG